MNIFFTRRDTLKIFHGALCDGLSALRYYDLELTFNDTQYQLSRRKLRKCCYEDVLIQMLKDGFPLRLKDMSEDTRARTLTFKLLIKRLPTVDLGTIAKAISGDGDSQSADIILQTCFFGKVIYG